MAEARQGLRLIIDSLEPLRVERAEYWFMRDARIFRQPVKGSVFLLPAFDEYTVAYADRSAMADEIILAQIAHGISSNIIINGRIAGTWKRRLSKNAVVVTCKLLRRLTSDERAGLTRAAGEYGRFIGKTASISI